MRVESEGASAGTSRRGTSAGHLAASTELQRGGKLPTQEVKRGLRTTEEHVSHARADAGA